MKSFLRYAPELSGASILYFHTLCSLRAHHRECLQSNGCQMAGVLFSPEFPQGSLAHVGGLQLPMTVISLFTDMAGNILFLSSLLNHREFPNQSLCSYRGAALAQCFQVSPSPYLILPWVMDCNLLEGKPVSIHPHRTPHISVLQELSQLIGTESQADISSSSQAISSLPFFTHPFF